MKVLRVRCTPVTDISKEIVMAHNKRCLEVRNRDQDWSWWSVDPNHFDVPADWFQPLFEQLFWTVSKTSISFERNSKLLHLMKDIIYHSPTLHVSSRSTMKFGNKSLRLTRAHIWSSLSDNITSALSTQNWYKTSKILWKSGLVLHMKAIYVTTYKLTVTRYIQANKKFNLIIIVNSSSFWY